MRATPAPRRRSPASTSTRATCCPGCSRSARESGRGLAAPSSAQGPAVSERPLRIAHVGPVATSTPPPKSGSVEVIMSLLTEGLVARGHDVTLFATGDSKTAAKLHAIYPHGYWHDEAMWPWELYEMLNLAAAVEHARDFDVIHYEAAYYPMSLAFARLSPTPIVQTLHHAPGPDEVRLWSRYPEAPFIAISREQARRLEGLNVLDVVLHGIDIGAFAFRAQPEDYLLFLGRFTEGKGVLQAIEVARRVGMRLILAAAEEDYYHEHVAPHVDGVSVVYFGEADHEAKVRLFGGARALLYPVQAAEPFGLVLAEAMVCGTPVAALDKGAVREIVEDGVTGCVFDDLDAMVAGLPRVFALDRSAVYERAVARFGADRMVDEYVAAYRHVIAWAADGGRAAHV
ncbi:MAG: glycosyltransferase family 4 protein [Gemmatimonadetes bacterium]|nr:glycosyltransferase family 4 protein [Gemmatimonadota bacterium]